MTTGSDRIDHIYTADEVAARLRLTNRAVMKLARKHGWCARSGRAYLFSETDLLALWQAMREPAQEPRRVSSGSLSRASRRALSENLKWLGDHPPTSVDRRVLNILRWLDKQTEGKSYRQIDRAREKTIDLLLRKGLVAKCGIDGEGLALVRIAPAGRDQIRIADRWAKMRAARNGRAR